MILTRAPTTLSRNKNMSKKLAIPDPVPALIDPNYPQGDFGPYSQSALRDVCGTRINPECPYYQRRSFLTDGDKCHLKTAAYPRLQEWIEQVYGFDPRGFINQPPVSQWPMTAVIPRLAVSGAELAYPLPVGTYALDYHRLNSNPHQPPERDWAPKVLDSLPEGSNLLLSFFDNRKLVGGLWTIQGFWESEFLDQFAGIIMPDFSNFVDDPYPQALVGERMMQVFAQEGAAAGRTIIPTIAWPDQQSLVRQVETWASQYPAINTIHLDCYGPGADKTGWTWRWLLGLEKYFRDYPQIRWIISGMHSGWAIAELNEIFPNNNYNLMMSVSPHIDAMVGSTDPNYRAKVFRKKIRTLEEFYSGKVGAERQPRPERWVTSLEELAKKK
jgi:hypothetical protein